MELRKFQITITVSDDVPRDKQEDLQTQLLNHIWPAAQCVDLCEKLVADLPYSEHIAVRSEEA